MNEDPPADRPVVSSRTQRKGLWRFPWEEDFEPVDYWSFGAVDPVPDHLGSDPLDYPLDAQRLPAGAAQTPRTAARPAPPSRDRISRSTSLLELGLDPGRPQERIALSKDGTRTINDPDRAGVNRQVRARIAAGHSAANIAAFLETVRPGFSKGLLPYLAKTVSHRRAYPHVPMSKYLIDLERLEIPLTSLQNIVNDAAQSTFGAYVTKAADKFTFGTLADWTDDPDLARRGMAEVERLNPIASMAGDFAGEGLMTSLGGQGLLSAGLRKGAPVVSELLYGAAQGAGSSGDDRLGGAAQGILTSALGIGASRQLRRVAGTGHEKAREAINEYVARRAAVERQRQISKWLGHGFSPLKAEYLASPYVVPGTKRRGHHFIPANRVVGWINDKFELPERFIEGSYNVLKPKGMSIGDFYQRHFEVDPSFYGARLPKSVGGGGWSGKRLNLQKRGQLGRIWYGSPTKLKVVTGAGLGGLGGTGYYLLSDQDENDVSMPRSK